MSLCWFRKKMLLRVQVDKIIIHIVSFGSKMALRSPQQKLAALRNVSLL